MRGRSRGVGEVSAAMHRRASINPTGSPFESLTVIYIDPAKFVRADCYAVILLSTQPSSAQPIGGTFTIFPRMVTW